MTHYIGIDLGTTNSAICTFDGQTTHVQAISGHQHEIYAGGQRGNADAGRLQRGNPAAAFQLSAGGVAQRRGNGNRDHGSGRLQPDEKGRDAAGGGGGRDRPGRPDAGACGGGHERHEGRADGRNLPDLRSGRRHVRYFRGGIRGRQREPARAGRQRNVRRPGLGPDDSAPGGHSLAAGAFPPAEGSGPEPGIPAAPAACAVCGRTGED